MKLAALLAAGFIFTTAAAPMALAGNHEGDHKGGWFAKVDADGDGFISKSEFLAKHEEKFNKMDTDGDGKISKEEKMAAKEHMKKKMKEHNDKMPDEKY